MGQILELNSWIIRRLAIDQIINSYFDIVKELVDNSIDGESLNIKININFFEKFIEVVDDGVGMGEEDLKKCTLAYHTSKFKDFSQIESLGFRGEGLFAIKESGNLEITTRRGEDLYGHLLKGEKEIEKVASNKGTKVKVGNIFYKTPSKNAFLNSRSDFNQIISFLQQMALAYSSVKFTLYKNNNYYMCIGGCENIINQIFNIENQEKILINNLELNFQIEIYTNKRPKEKKGKVLFFINKRPILDSLILNQILKILEGQTGVKKLSFLLVFLTIDPAHVDFNLTPSKNKAKISILKEIQETIKDFFLKRNNKVNKKNENELYEKETELDYGSLEGWFSYNSKIIFAKYNKEVYVLDQHGISERILLNKIKNQEYESQLLLEKTTIKLNEEERENFLKKQKKLEAMKFMFYQLENYIVVYGTPSFLEVENIEMVIKEFLEEEDSYIFLHKLSKFACKNSIKKGYKIKEEELKEFFKHIKNDKSCDFCNHGRRTYIKLEKKDIFKWLDLNV